MADSCKSTAGILAGILLALAPACPVLAQRTNVYSLSALVDSARRHLPLLLEKQALVESAKAGIIEAKNDFLPQLNAVEELSVGSANDLTGPFLPVPGVLHSIAGSINKSGNYQAVTANMASLYGQYDLVTFGLKNAKIANARAVAGLTQADLDKERYLVSWDIARLYFNILSHRYQLTVDEEDVRRYDSMYTISTALTGSGVNPGVDSSLARAGLSRTRVKYNEALGELKRLQDQLTYLTGIGEPAIVMDTSTAIPTLDLSQEGAANPLLDYFDRQKAHYNAQELLARKSYLPRVVLGAGGWARGSSIQYSNVYENASEGLGYQRLNYLAGVGITYDLFNGVHRHDRTQVLNQQVQAADYALQQQRLSLHNQQVQADESIRTARANLDELPVQLKAATDAYQTKLAQYRAGIINLVDVLTAAFELTQAQTDYIRTLDEWYTASLDKAAATGNLDLFIQTIK